MADKDNKKKSGLHKEISSIFDGVPVPSKQGVGRPRGGGAEQSRAGFNSPRPAAKGPQNPQIPGSRQQAESGAARRGAPGRARRGAAIKTADQSPLRQMTKKLFAPKPGVSVWRQAVTVAAIPILAIVLIVVLSPFFKTGAARPGKPIEPPAPTTVIAADTEIDWQKPAPYPAAYRDPMELTAEMKTLIETAVATTVQIGPGVDPTQADRVGELTVKGIVFSEDKPSAVIGTRISHVGDIIAGVTIVRITERLVEFEKDGETWTQAVEP